MPLGWLSVAAAIDESLHGPLPGDLVDTQGKYLLNRPSTPIYSQEHDVKFSQHLTERLQSLVFQQNLRSHKYGVDIADEYPISHTPIEIRSSWANEQVEFDKFLDELPPTPSDDGTPSSTMSGSTLVSFRQQHHPSMSVSEKMELLGSIKEDVTPLRPVSERKLSHLENCIIQTPQPQTKQTPPATTTTTKTTVTTILTPQPRTGIKRRHSDAENDYPWDSQPQHKRRFAAPALHRLISVG